MSDTILQTKVVVCGGGPGGVTCAYVLGKYGIPTILIDKKKYNKIGDKVCGDALHPELTEIVNQWEGIPEPRSETNELMERLDFIILRGRSEKAELRLDDYSATVDRLRYGQALLKAAEAYDSVTIMDESPIRKVLVENKKVVGVIVKHEGELIQINCDVVVDASGAGGVVRRMLPDDMCVKFPKRLKPEELLVAYREIIRTKEPHGFQKGMYLIYEKELDEIMPGYYWMFSRGTHEINIGLGYYKRPENNGKNIRKINAIIRDRHFKNFEVLDARGDRLPGRLPLPSLVHNGFIAVGDAGALVNPINGEGHGPALLTGVKAAQFIIKALEQNDTYETGPLWEYNKWVWIKYGALHSLGIAIIKFIDKFGYESFDWLLAHGIIEQEDILSNLENPEPKLQGMFLKAIKLLRRPKLLLGLRNTLRLSDKLQKHAKSYPEINDFNSWNKKLSKLVDTKI